MQKKLNIISIVTALFLLLLLLSSCSDSNKKNSDNDVDLSKSELDIADDDTSFSENEQLPDEDSVREKDACPQHINAVNDFKAIGKKSRIYRMTDMKDSYATMDFTITGFQAVFDDDLPIAHILGDIPNHEKIGVEGETYEFYVSLIGYDLTGKMDKLSTHVWKLEEKIQNYMGLDKEYGMMSVFTARDKEKGLILASLSVGAYHDEACPIWPSEFVQEFTLEQVHTEKCVPWKVEAEIPSLSGPYDELIAPPVLITCKKNGETLLLKDGEIGELCNFQIHINKTRMVAKEDKDWAMEPTGMRWSIYANIISLPLLNGTLY